MWRTVGCNISGGRVRVIADGGIMFGGEMIPIVLRRWGIQFWFILVMDTRCTSIASLSWIKLILPVEQRRTDTDLLVGHTRPVAESWMSDYVQGNALETPRRQQQNCSSIASCPEH